MSQAPCACAGIFGFCQQILRPPDHSGGGVAQQLRIADSDWERFSWHPRTPFVADVAEVRELAARGELTEFLPMESGARFCHEPQLLSFRISSTGMWLNLE